MFCHPTYSGSPKRKHCPCLCFRSMNFILCEIHILTKAGLSYTALCAPKQDHARGNRLWCQSQKLCALQCLVSPRGGPVYEVAQALARSPWLQSSNRPASYTSTSTMFISKNLCVSSGQNSGVWEGLSHSSIHVKLRPWEMAHRNGMVLLASMEKFVLLCLLQVV